MTLRVLLETSTSTRVLSYDDRGLELHISHATDLNKQPTLYVSRNGAQIESHAIHGSIAIIDQNSTVLVTLSQETLLGEQAE